MLVRGKHYATGQVVDIHGNADAGIIEAIAPLDASDDQQIADAVAVGAKVSTHLGNGSHATLEQCVVNVIAWAGLSVANAARMVTENPTVLLGRRRRVLEKGASANLILFSRTDGRIRVNDAVVGGKVIFMDAKTRVVR